MTPAEFADWALRAHAGSTEAVWIIVLTSCDGLWATLTPPVLPLETEGWVTLHAAWPGFSPMLHG